MSKQKNYSLKDELFNKDKVNWLANQFYAVDKKFEKDKFIDEVMSELGDLELKARIVFIANVLKKYLAKDFLTAAAQLEAALPPKLDPHKKDNDFGEFIIAPLGEFVVQNGLSKKYLNTSLKLIREITMRFSMEDAIRHFIRSFPDETLRELNKWKTDDNYHVRRLVSEGTRPLLPWSGRIQVDQEKMIDLLDYLYIDETRYVTRSVANHLNDISKIKPGLVIKTLKKWQKEGKQNDKELNWIINHSLRTLVKKGDKSALALLGYKTFPDIKVNDFSLKNKKVKIGDNLEFSFMIEGSSHEKLLIDYVIDFVKHNGGRKPKVHKLKKLILSKDEKLKLSKKHLFKKGATTLSFYPGLHTVTLQINGQKFGSLDFTITN